MKLIASTTIQPRDSATLPYRFVMRLQSESSMPYVVHMETMPDEPKSNLHGFHCGDYCATQAEALARMTERADKARLAVLDFNGQPLTGKWRSELREVVPGFKG